MTDYLIDRLINVNNVYMFVEGQETALKLKSSRESCGLMPLEHGGTEYLFT